MTDTPTKAETEAELLASLAVTAKAIRAQHTSPEAAEKLSTVCWNLSLAVASLADSDR